MNLTSSYRSLNVLLLALLALLLSSLVPKTVLGYETNMDASVVVGQSDFTSSIAGATQATLNSPRGVNICDGKLVVADSGNNRVLIWNALPTNNSQPADLVLGQADFVSNEANRGGLPDANTLFGVWGVACANGKLMVADTNNNRVLVWNTFPTTNGQPANVVVGQADMTSNAAHDGNDLDKLQEVSGVATDGEKLVVLDSNNQRFLVWNSIPTINGQPADVVVGANHGEGCTQDRISGKSINIHIGLEKLFVAATFPNGAYRVLIWNTIPTANQQPADVVVGQPDFTTCLPTTGTADGMQNVFDVATDSHGRMFAADRGSQRVLIFNSIPTTNGVAADLVIGQASFSDILPNQGQVLPGPNTLKGARGVTAIENRLIISDGDNNRVLIFYDEDEVAEELPSAGNTSGEEHIDSSSSEAPRCSQIPPSSAPDLFQIDASSTSAALFFAPAGNPYSNYVVSYGYSSGDERFGTQFDLSNWPGVRGYLIQDLEPNTTYYFKIRAGNGCAAGEWSDYMSIRTRLSGATWKSFYKHWNTFLTI